MIEKKGNTQKINTRKTENIEKLGRGRMRDERIDAGTNGVERRGIVNIETLGTIDIATIEFGTTEFEMTEFEMTEFGTTEFGTKECRIDITKIDIGTLGTTEIEKTGTAKKDTGIHETTDTVTNDIKLVPGAIGQGLQLDLQEETQKNRPDGTTRTTENIMKTELTLEKKKNTKKVQVPRENIEVLRRLALQVPATTLPQATPTAAPAQVTILTVPAVLLMMMMKA